MDTFRSDKLFERSQTLMPGGVNSPVRAFRAVGRNPLFIEKAAGAHIWDVDGNEFIDYVCSWGPGILGHADRRVIEKVKKACENGLTFGAPTEKESVLAEMIREAFPSMEMMRLVSSGTEAVMSAVRAARGYTGRDYIVKFSGNYHGHSDGLLVKAGSGLLTSAVPDSGGIPQGYTSTTLIAEYNDEASVTSLFREYGNKIACIIVEPVSANMGVVPPKQGFLEFLRKITKENGTVLIFDEVITGFRLSYGGAQEYYGIIPDMTALGKIVGGGMPLGAYGGKKEIMKNISPLGSVYQAGTLSGNPIAVTAGIATLEILRDYKDIYRRINQKAEKIEKAFIGNKVHVNRTGSLLSPFFNDCKVKSYKEAQRSDTKKYADYFGYMLEHGIYIAPSQFEAMFVSDAHDDKDIEKTCETIENYFRTSD